MTEKEYILFQLKQINFSCSYINGVQGFQQEVSPSTRAFTAYKIYEIITYALKNDSNNIGKSISKQAVYDVLKDILKHDITDDTEITQNQIQEYI